MTTRLFYKMEPIRWTTHRAQTQSPRHKITNRRTTNSSKNNPAEDLKMDSKGEVRDKEVGVVLEVMAGKEGLIR